MTTAEGGILPERKSGGDVFYYLLAAALGNLEQAAARIAAFRPEIVKVVSTARSLADNLAVLS